MPDGRELDATAMGGCIGVIVAYVFLRFLKHINMEVKSDVGSIVVLVVFVFVFQYGSRLIARRTAKPRE